ncbi:MAG: TetR/AcrR family transcriptional regulator [Pseudomonadales bacterium]
MPYTSQHKAQSREKILQSAYQLFSSQGFDAVTVDSVMQRAKLTRGAFYNHFKSKAELYAAAVGFGASQSPLLDAKPAAVEDRQWVRRLLDNYLSLGHLRAERACPLAFMATDIALRSEPAKAAYARAFKGMNDHLQQRLGHVGQVSRAELEAATTMMIGAVAIARSLEEVAAQALLANCHGQVALLLKL